MAIRRASRLNDPDFMANKCDEQLDALEDRLNDLYSDAVIETQTEFEAFISKYREEDARKREQLEAGEITAEEYSEWRQRQILRSNRYIATLDSLTDTMVNTDILAIGIIREELPFIVAESYNFVQALGYMAADEAGITVGTFQIYNASTVQAIIRDNPDLLPYVNVEEDRAWNRSRINREITQSIVQGDSIPEVANRLRGVTNMDRNSAIRNARTSMTAAENLGRTESANYIRSQGVPIEEVWSATHDDRTRETHLMLDGTKKDENGYYGAWLLKTPLRFPGDPQGDPEEVYNCRCRDSIVLQGIDHSHDSDLYAQFMRTNYPDDYENLQEWERSHGRSQAREEAIRRRNELRHLTRPYSAREIYRSWE